jgi:PAS domain S-box-containing protein
MDIEHFILIGKVFSGIAGIGGGLWGLVKIWKFLDRICISPVKNEYQKITGLHAKLEEAIPLIHKISGEFTCNGGSTLKDAINRVESKLSGHEARIEVLLSNSSLATFESDLNGKFVNVNREWRHLVDAETSEILGDAWIQGVIPADRDLVRQEWSKSVAEKREFNFKTKMGSVRDGNYFDVLICSSIIRGKDGQAKGLFGYVKKV